jgi:hypothetical protein
METYLNEFITEASELERSGIDINGHTFHVMIHSIVCDAPARSLLKGTKGHTAYYGCDRCTQRGEWQGKMTYPATDAPLRSNKAFDSMLDSEHHREKSTLSKLNVGLVTHVCLDYMHLVCLGIMRRLILLWMRGPLSCRLSANIVGQISEHLIEMRSFIPSEFARKPRTLYDVDRWKATEFRQFMLYTGPVVLLNKLSDKLYKHFMLLSVGMYCCLNANHCHKYADYAQQLFVLFVQHGMELYGQGFLVYNVHSLIHIVDDVRLFGALDNVSAFPFENHMRLLKKSIHQPNMPLQQIIRRMSEKEQLKSVTVIHHGVVLKKVHENGPLPVELQSVSEMKQYRSLRCDSIIIKTSEGDSVVVLVNGDIVKVQNIVSVGGQILIIYNRFLMKNIFYDYPLSSTDLGIYEVANLSSELQTVHFASVMCKCVHVLSKDKKICICMPLAHKT